MDDIPIFVVATPLAVYAINPLNDKNVEFYSGDREIMCMEVSDEGIYHYVVDYMQFDSKRVTERCGDIVINTPSTKNRPYIRKFNTLSGEEVEKDKRNLEDLIYNKEESDVSADGREVYYKGEKMYRLRTEDFIEHCGLVPYEAFEKLVQDNPLFKGFFD